MTRKYDMNFHFIDRLLQKQLPSDVVGIIAEYTMPSKTKLVMEMKNHMKTKVPKIPKFIKTKIIDYLQEINNAVYKQEKLPILYNMFDYLLDYSFIIMDKNIANNAGFIYCVKNKFQSMFDSYIINSRYYYYHIYKEDIHISPFMKSYIKTRVTKSNRYFDSISRRNINLRYCSICELHGHGTRRCPRYKK